MKFTMRNSPGIYPDLYCDVVNRKICVSLDFNRRDAMVISRGILIRKACKIGASPQNRQIRRCLDIQNVPRCSVWLDFDIVGTIFDVVHRNRVCVGDPARMRGVSVEVLEDGFNDGVERFIEVLLQKRRFILLRNLVMSFGRFYDCGPLVVGVQSSCFEESGDFGALIGLIDSLDVCRAIHDAFVEFRFHTRLALRRARIRLETMGRTFHWSSAIKIICLR